MKKTIPHAPRLPFVLALSPGFIFMALLQWASSRNPFGARRFTLFDDAMISMDYARTLATTGEFVWFPGAPRVQGFTNPLWTLWMALIHLVGFEGSSAALVVTLSGMVLILATSWIVYSLVVKSVSEHRILLGSIAAGSIPFLYPTTYWTMRGMEVGLLAFLILLLIRGVLVQNLDQTSPRLSLMWIPTFIGIATRFDFLVLCIVAIFWTYIWSDHANRFHILLKNLLFTTFSALFVAGFQRFYWGSWFPNTYHLKMDGVDLFDKLARGIASSGKAAVMIVILLFGLSQSRKASQFGRRTIWISVSMFAAMAAYSVYIGGDAWEDQMLNRFYATVLPLVPLVVIIGLHNTVTRKSALFFSAVLGISTIGMGFSVNPFNFSVKKLMIGLAIALFCATLLYLATSSRSLRQKSLSTGVVLVVALLLTSFEPLARHIRHRDILGARTNLHVTQTVETLRTVTQPEALVATVWAGVPAYYSDRKMIDLLGKNDVFIARSTPQGDFFPGHNKWDYDYSIGEFRPDVIFQTFTRGIDESLPERLTSWGYTKWCAEDQFFPASGMYFKTNSEHVLWDKLSPCS